MIGDLRMLIIPSLAGAIEYYFTKLAVDTVDCENVGELTTSARTALTGLRTGIEENKAELNYQLAARDILIANINSLTSELQEINDFVL